ncbi:hypothetical protein [Acinetobacter pittii]|nr:hypothetical protein [Acinetobacter pittii]
MATRHTAATSSWPAGGSAHGSGRSALGAAQRRDRSPAAAGGR